MASPLMPDVSDNEWKMLSLGIPTTTTPATTTVTVATTPLPISTAAPTTQGLP